MIRPKFFSSAHLQTLDHISSIESEIPTDQISTSNSENPQTQKTNLLCNIVEDFISPNGDTKTDDTSLPDLSTFEDDNLAQDAAALNTRSKHYFIATEPLEHETILLTRTYDISITYDKYYQTPRIWLFGYDESNAPLSSDDMSEDIMQDYLHQTVTFEPHPFFNNLLHASVHPCQHAAVMLRLISNLRDASHTLEIRSDQYLFLFLKFIQSVIPTIDYDHTIQLTSQRN